MPNLSGKRISLLTVVVATALSTPALADSIDGNWCNAEGQHILIKGRSAVTPSGVHLEGEYSRHFFSYIAPQGEPEAGAKVLMRLAGETRVYVNIDGKAGEPSVWKRCEEVSMLVLPGRGKSQPTW